MTQWLKMKISHHLFFKTIFPSNGKSKHGTREFPQGFPIGFTGHSAPLRPAPRTMRSAPWEFEVMRNPSLRRWPSMVKYVKSTLVMKLISIRMSNESQVSVCWDWLDLRHLTFWCIFQMPTFGFVGTTKPRDRTQRYLEPPAVVTLCEPNTVANFRFQCRNTCVYISRNAWEFSAAGL